LTGELQSFSLQIDAAISGASWRPAVVLIRHQLRTDRREQSLQSLKFQPIGLQKIYLGRMTIHRLARGFHRQARSQDTGRKE
jgi:hypothetical protein